VSILKWCIPAVVCVVVAQPVLAAPLATAVVSVDNASDTLVADGVVEAVRQSDIAAQVTGRITALLVKAGDHVKAGQALLRIDERIAQQQALAGRSQVVALAAQLDAASKEYQRKQRLFQQGFLSQAALEKAESDYKTTQAQTRAQMAQVQSAVVETGLHALMAPYAGIVSKVNVELGDMASPGRALLTVYDPSALRVVVNVPQTRVGALKRDPALIEIPAVSQAQVPIKAIAMIVLPTADPVSQMVQVRLALPSSASGLTLTPGMFARARLAIESQGQVKRLSVPSQAVFKRSELTAVYVMDANTQPAKPQLRLVRAGRIDAGRTEILAGLEPGEKVVLDPLAAIPSR
jgi:membrane fusion protein, multidrug efflux system